MWWLIFGAIIGYVCGYWDRVNPEPPPPLRGTYDSGEHDDRVEDYGDYDV